MKEKIGPENKVWRSLAVTLPYEVLVQIGAVPGDKVQFYNCGDSVVIEKA